jgi:hypothetical protein
LYSVATKSRRLHLIFVYRHSEGHGKCHVEEHFADALDMVASLPLDGDVVDTISIVCGSKVRGRHIPSCAHEQFTQRIKAQIMDAVLGGRYPVIVSMGANALSHNVERLQLSINDFESQY